MRVACGIAEDSLKALRERAQVQLPAVLFRQLIALSGARGFCELLRCFECCYVYRS